MKRTGLTLGKFAPLHNGHIYLFDYAIGQVDNLIVLIYESSLINISLNVRAGWIRALYPEIEVIECWDGPEGYSSERGFEIEQENYILKVLEGRKITHFFSSEFYGGHVSRALRAEDVRVDEERCNVNISATKVRLDQKRYRNYVPDIVYRDLVVKVVFVGAMSSGKSTITRALAEKFNTSYVDEYGREYWTENQVDRRLELEEFDIIARRHLENEEREFLNAGRYCFIDTNAVTTYTYCLDYHKRSTGFLEQCALENSARYDLYFLCDIDIPYDDTWDRSGPQKRDIFHRKVVADLNERKIPYIVLRGTLEERMEKVEKILGDFEMNSNFYGKEI